MKTESKINASLMLFGVVAIVIALLLPNMSDEELSIEPISDVESFLHILEAEETTNGHRYLINIHEDSGTIYNFRDTEHSVVDLKNSMVDVEHLVGQSGQFNEEAALAFAVDILNKLGHNESNVLPPQVMQWTWNKGEDDEPQTLPFFKVFWPWKVATNRPYFDMEIDGIRGKITKFTTLKGSPAEKYVEK